MTLLGLISEQKKKEKNKNIKNTFVSARIAEFVYVACYMWFQARSRRHQRICIFLGPLGAVPFPQNEVLSLKKCNDFHLYIIQKVELKVKSNGNGNHWLTAAPLRRLQLCRPSAKLFMIGRMWKWNELKEFMLISLATGKLGANWTTILIALLKSFRHYKSQLWKASECQIVNGFQLQTFPAPRHFGAKGHVQISFMAVVEKYIKNRHNQKNN